MKLETVSAPLGSAAVPAPIGVPLVEQAPTSWRRWLAPALSTAILIAALAQLRTLDWRALIAMVPASPLFWIVFLVSYLIPPASEWVIFRALWALPGRGFLALLRKRLSNEILLGYSGEVYFYGWARRNAALVAAPFGAVKDVAILSAATGNIVTLVLVAASWPLLRDLNLGLSARLIGYSAAVVTAGSLLTMVFRKSLLSLPRRDLVMIAIVHLARIIATTVLTAILWALILPAAPLSWWLMLATLRMVVSRLPLLPNKDLVFAGLAAFLVGHRAQVTELVSLLAGLTLATHVLLGVGLGVSELAGVENRR
ncbi:hypothetical protein [Sphingomonas morindae]|uniref:Flippase-like domain-containing protein n=1 Tax=Sphingomonas morindae TaxID=1541170 RepID=A0ABY4X5E8_9SPHN|nr:hypothetical protein [Sphingomonas morindae]USI72060.1 hypothetical protein LHA26_12180 [Sphingomonas morindae]